MILSYTADCRHSRREGMLPRMDQLLRNRLAACGLSLPKLLLPASHIDLQKWAVIACDQHTSEPEYWEEVARIVGDAPSTLHLVYPEVYLGESGADRRIAAIHSAMRRYIDDGTLVDAGEGVLATIRETAAGVRTGLNLAVDLEHYDFHPGSGSLIRASEETIEERLPPRIRIRQGAPLEIPHTLVLIDDRDEPVIAPLVDGAEPVYETSLMLGGGKVCGVRISSDRLGRLADMLEEILKGPHGGFLFAVGDGNHSLATAKAVWERMKESCGPNHPARHALVELVSIYDPGLAFEPIHRIVTTETPDRWVDAFVKALGGEYRPIAAEELHDRLNDTLPAVGIVTSSRSGAVLLQGQELPVARVQEYLSQDGCAVDYVHGREAIIRHGRRPGFVGLLLPEFDPAQVFPTVASDGVLPRKAFSLGDAQDKRYYLEARAITE
jgi:hypothetical protein